MFNIISESKNKNYYITVSKEFDFAMAHNLKNHEGLCKYIHGHNYKLVITVKNIIPYYNNNNIIVQIINKVNDSDYGMVIDFKKLNEIVKNTIIKKYDHSFLLWEEYTDNEKINKFFEGLTDQELKENRIIKVNYRPTAENMCIQFYNEISESLKESNIEIDAIRLYETENSYAELKII